MRNGIWIDVVELTRSRFKNWRRLHFRIALLQLKASITNVTVRYEEKARKTIRTDDNTHPVLANAAGRSSDPVPTIKLNTKTKPTWWWWRKHTKIKTKKFPLLRTFTGSTCTHPSRIFIHNIKLIRFGHHLNRQHEIFEVLLFCAIEMEVLIYSLSGHRFRLGSFWVCPEFGPIVCFDSNSS